MKRFFLVSILFFSLLFLSSCSCSKRENPEDIISTPKLSSCDVVCNKIYDSCPLINPEICLDLCSSWDENQRSCVDNFSSCEMLYDKCDIERGFVFEPIIDDKCSSSCYNYVKKCNIQAEKSKDVNDQVVFDECILQCKDWTDDQTECIKNAQFCTDIFINCS